MTNENQNRLQHSSSAYLRSAAHQPIEWHEWGDDAFARAKSEDKPILLDIGAVWCHWCHVIDRESYENPEIAAIINKLYVAVKVDRDERPDVDARYQAAIGAISGQGGWPLTGFLTPEGKPFYGGTYFPPNDSMGRPGFRRILLTVADSYKNRRKEIEESASSLAEMVTQAESFRGAHGDFDPGAVDEMLDAIARMFDSHNGGFGRSPKFAHPAALDLILEKYQSSREENWLDIAEATLEKMARGGVYDQLAGGFHRYSVDEKWLVPHFEKMTYDNSELLKNYLHGWQVTGNPLFREIAEGIIGWVNEVLSDQTHGGFYASQDADYSLDDDGDYFTWTLDELRAALSPGEARVMEEYYDVEAHGEMHHNPSKNVLWIARTPEEIATNLGTNAEDVRLITAGAKRKMLAARKPRPTPYVDDTLYVGWNGMFVTAYLEAAHVLKRLDCKDFALKTLERLIAEAWTEGRGFAHRVGGPFLPGSLDDQVFAANALLDAYEGTLNRRYFELAQRTAEVLLAKYYDAESGGFFDRPVDAPPLGGLDLRRKPIQDSPTPGANTIAAIFFDRLHSYSGDVRFQQAAHNTLEMFAAIAPQMGLFASSYGLAAILHSRHALQVVITGAAGNAEAGKLEETARSVFRYGKAVLRVTPEVIAAGSLAPMLQKTLPHLRAEIPQAFVCVETTCFPPTAAAEKLKTLLLDSATDAAKS